MRVTSAGECCTFEKTHYMRNKDGQDYICMIGHILEEKKAYLEKDMSAGLLAIRLGIKQKKLERIIMVAFGLSLDSLIDMFRIVYARTLLKSGTPYEYIWHLSGFSSLEHMETAFECIVV